VFSEQRYIRFFTLGFTVNHLPSSAITITILLIGPLDHTFSLADGSAAFKHTKGWENDGHDHGDNV
jgi:hypothetical protein